MMDGSCRVLPSGQDRWGAGRLPRGVQPPNANLQIMQRSRRGFRGLQRKGWPGWLEGRQGNSGPSSCVPGGGAGGDVPVQGPVGMPAMTVAPVLGCELVSALIITRLCS